MIVQKKKKSVVIVSRQYLKMTHSGRIKLDLPQNKAFEILKYQH